MRNISHSAVHIRNGFWKQKQDMVRQVTAQAVYDRFTETGRFAALACDWKPGEEKEPHVFWDSDIAKWIEGVAYLLEESPAPELYNLARKAIDTILKSADEDGYYNCYYLTHDEPRFTVRGNHELYCAGHLIEAAIAWYTATGERDFLDGMCKYADYIERIFKIEQSAPFATPGHPELELALVRLANATGEQRYMELAKFFIDMHGNNPKDEKTLYNQDDIPLRDRSTIDGHSVRALYLLCAMADVAAEYDDDALAAACRRCFDNATQKRMYITGGVGSTHLGEAFTADYDLPNRTAYAETCAAIALALFAGRMQQLGADSAFADTVERAIYNGALAGVSLDGRSFFYENPLEIDPDFNDVNHSTAAKAHYPITQRVEVFSCSCCPPNIVRFLPSIADFAYSMDGNTVYVNQYMDSEAAFDGVTISQTTDYPVSGTIRVQASGMKKLALRIPGWCGEFTLNAPYTMQNGYAVIETDGSTDVMLELAMPVTPMSADPRVHADAGRIAFTRGPLVYCMEGVDNGKDLTGVRVAADAAFTQETADSCFTENIPPVPVLSAPAVRPVGNGQLYRPAGTVCTTETTARFIPYYAYANRGTTEMQVWVLEK